MIGHEAGHALKPGEHDNSNLAINPDEVAKVGLGGEGVALTQEYLVAREIGSPMWSDSTGTLKAGMHNLASLHGVHTPAFETGAKALGANYYHFFQPSNSHASFTYQEYYANSWVAAKIVASQTEFE